MFWQGGGLLQARREGDSGSPGPGGHRGRAEFSRASRRRLLYTLGKVRRLVLPHFVTLTYPGVWVDDPAKWKRDMDCFFRRLFRRWPGAAAVWRLEFQERGAPHFHVLLWGWEGENVWALRVWVARAWYEVVGSGDERHLRAGTQVDEVRSYRGVLAYASKYMSKADRSRSGVGRWWGVANREMMPWATAVVVALTDREAVKLLRLMRRFARLRGRAYRSLTVLGDGDFWLMAVAGGGAV